MSPRGGAAEGSAGSVSGDARHTREVGAEDQQGTRRRGRPPASDSAETRQAIIDGARRLFGERGFGAVTNKDLAAHAGVTTGALYHYVESKLDLYLCVHRDVQLRIYRRFQEAEASQETFIGKLGAILDAAGEMHEEDPSLARFVGAVRADVQRHPEIGDALERHHAARERFFLEIVECGIRTGEIHPDDRLLVREFVRVILVGLTEGRSEAPGTQRLANESILRALRGTLVRPETGSSEH